MVRGGRCRFPGCQGTYLGNNHCSEPSCGVNQRSLKRSYLDDWRDQERRARRRLSREGGSSAAASSAAGATLLPRPPMPPPAVVPPPAPAGADLPANPYNFQALLGWRPPAPLAAPAPPSPSQALPVPGPPAPADGSLGAGPIGGTPMEPVPQPIDVVQVLEGLIQDGGNLALDLSGVSNHVAAFLDELSELLEQIRSHGVVVRRRR